VSGADAAGPEPVARLEGVHHRYGETVALEDVSLALPAGCLAGVIGPDGVGKSTLLGLVAGARAVQRGTVRVLGGDQRDRRHRRAVCTDVAYMAQGLGTNLYPDLSVHENVAFFARLFGLGRRERTERVGELLEATGLAAFRERHARNLSGGMKQKLGLCCALVHDPALLVLDEPTTGVDPLSRRQFWELIGRMRARRPDMSVLVSTAYMEEAERFDWLAVLADGRVLDTGAPSTIRERTGASSLERAFVALLPGEAGGRREPLRIPEREPDHGGPAIEARELTRRFGDFTAVDHVSFEIHRGEIFGFVGSNGCGKTTTMKMLTGLLPASEGEGRLFGRVLDARDRETRRRVGFMSQSFSLYGELTVRQNLELHARLYGVEPGSVARRVREVEERFELAGRRDALAQQLPLGIRQRLSLAVALIHEPEVLILDEPTSGVDPMARDAFWRHLVALSRDEGVTIFLSTHFMNEAERCDRIALMHAGRVLAVGTPRELARRRGEESLEEAFVDWLKEESAEAAAPDTGALSGAGSGPRRRRRAGRFAPGRLLAIAAREAREILRDPIRLAFALLGPVLLLVVNGYGISFDVEDLDFAVLDADRSPESRRYLEGFRGSRYFLEAPSLERDAELDRRLQSGELALALEIPPGFGRDLWSDEQTEVGVWLDGAAPFEAETARGYVLGVHAAYLDDLARRRGLDPPAAAVEVEARYRYNQEFESVYAIVPGVIMLVLVLIPAIMTAVGVVREKELGSIANLYTTPTTRLEFLLGKQLPYVGVGLLGAALLVALAVGLFRVPVQGSAPTLALGCLLYVTATTGLGLLISTFVKTQLAAIFATAILTTLPALNFSGLLSPVSSLTGGARAFGRSFPSAYFNQVSQGTFSKGLGWLELAPSLAALAGFAALYVAAACLLLRRQAR